uniref:Beta-lactamase-related domain-containing protein n=1 Tax=Mycena chlorophos TaxID=658473 RepID=A0ABQ0MDW9_MYCCL|nr:predicted protein [Mycena chlorophos]
MLAFLALFPAVLALTTPFQQPFSLPKDPDARRKLIPPHIDAFIREQQAYWNSSGLAVAVVRRSGLDEPRHSPEDEWDVEFGSYGVARADGTPVSPDTLFAIASDSKLFTAVGVGLLVKNESLRAARGTELRWDTKVKDVLGSEWGLMDEDMENGATLQDMLSHRTGMPRHDLSGFARKGGLVEM